MKFGPPIVTWVPDSNARNAADSEGAGMGKHSGESLSGKISDRIRGELKGKVNVNPERGSEPTTDNPPKHSGGAVGRGADRKAK